MSPSTRPKSLSCPPRIQSPSHNPAVDATIVRKPRYPSEQERRLDEALLELEKARLYAQYGDFAAESYSRFKNKACCKDLTTRIEGKTFQEVDAVLQCEEERHSEEWRNAGCPRNWPTRDRLRLACMRTGLVYENVRFALKWYAAADRCGVFHHGAGGGAGAGAGDLIRLREWKGLKERLKQDIEEVRFVFLGRKERRRMRRVIRGVRDRYFVIDDDDGRWHVRSKFLLEDAKRSLQAAKEAAARQERQGLKQDTDDEMEGSSIGSLFG